MGSLCVIDREPGSLDERQRSTPKALAEAAATALELRRYGICEHAALEREAGALRRQMHKEEMLTQKLRASEILLERTSRLAGVGGWELNLVTQEITWSAETCRIHDLPVGYQPSLDEALAFYAPEARPLIQAAVEKAIASGGAVGSATSADHRDGPQYLGAGRRRRGVCQRRESALPGRSVPGCHPAQTRR